MLNALLLLKEQALRGEVNKPFFGICLNLSKLLNNDSAYNFVARHSEGWKHHTGVYNHPVEFSIEEDKWEGKQLELRLSLIDHLITKAKLLEGL